MTVESTAVNPCVLHANVLDNEFSTFRSELAVALSYVYLSIVKPIHYSWRLSQKSGTLHHSIRSLNKLLTQRYILEMRFN